MNITHLRLYQVHQAVRAFIIYQLLYHYQMSENHRQLQAFFYLAAYYKPGKIPANQKTASRAKSKKTGKTPSIKDIETSSSIMFARFSNEKLRQVSYFDHKSYRFNSVDPVINKLEALYNPQAWNLYSYCNNNPITYYDPDGRLIFVAPWLLNPATIAAITAAATAGAIATHNLVKSIDIDKAIEGGVDIVSQVAAPTSGISSEVLKSVKGDDTENPEQMKKLGKGEIKKLKEGGEDIHKLKGKKKSAERDLYKNKKGDIFVKPKGGKGPGDPTGLNINDF